eukprot:gene6671-7372_t
MKKLLESDELYGIDTRTSNRKKPGDKLPWLRSKVSTTGSNVLSTIRNSPHKATTTTSPSPPTLRSVSPDTLSITHHVLDEDVLPLSFSVDNKNDQPREPDLPSAHSLRPCNKAQSLRKTLHFQPYKSTRPDLLDHLNLMIGQGLRTIPSKTVEEVVDGKNDDNDPSRGGGNEKDQEKLYWIYSTAFQVFINESTLYQKFLLDVKLAYEGYIEQLLHELASYQGKREEDVDIVSQCQDKMKSLEIMKNQELDLVRNQLNEMNNKYLLLQEEKKRNEVDSLSLKESSSTLRKEYEDLKNTCTMLTSSLSRMEEEYRNYQAAENIRGLEVASLRATEQKLNEEIERLQGILQSNEQIIGMMVGQDVVNNLEVTITMLREELKRMEITHRQLLMRYATLKTAVDDSFTLYKQQQEQQQLQLKQQQQQEEEQDQQQEAAAAVSSTLSSMTKEKVEEAIGEILNPHPILVRKQNKDMPSDAIGKVLYLVEKGVAAKLIVEVMLDHITQGKSSNRSSNQMGPYVDFSNEALAAIQGNNNGTTAMTTTSGAGSPDKGSISSSFTFSYEGEDGLVISDEFKSPWMHFDGLGQDESIPTYLRFNGKIQNLCLSKKEIVSVLNELWDAKQAYDNHILAALQGGGGSSTSNDVVGNVPAVPYAPPPAVETVPSNDQTLRTPRQISNNNNNNNTNTRLGGGGSSSLLSSSLLESMPLNPKFSTFIEYYLKDKYKNSLLATEMYYNILDALKRFANLSDCKLFSTVFEEKMSIEIKDDLQSMLDMLQDETIKECKLQNGTGNNDISVASNSSSAPNIRASFGGVLPGLANNRLASEQFMRLLRRLFPNKTEQSFAKLIKAIAIDCPNARYIGIEEILLEDHSGNRSHFLEQIRLQHISEAMNFEKHVLECIDQFAEGDNNTTIGKLREAIIHADPNKLRPEVNQWLARGCGCSVEEVLLMEAKRAVHPVIDFKRLLRSVLLKRSPPPARVK